MHRDCKWRSGDIINKISGKWPRLPPENRGLRYPPVVTERPQPKTYGKPLIVLEDQQKNTFVYSAGNWVPHAESIAQCRELGQVKELPQRLNDRVRYEVRYAE